MELLAQEPPCPASPGFATRSRTYQDFSNLRKRLQSRPFWGMKGGTRVLEFQVEQDSLMIVIRSGCDRYAICYSYDMAVTQGPIQRVCTNQEGLKSMPFDCYG